LPSVPDLESALTEDSSTTASSVAVNGASSTKLDDASVLAEQPRVAPDVSASKPPPPELPSSSPPVSTRERTEREKTSPPSADAREVPARNESSGLQLARWLALGAGAMVVVLWLASNQQHEPAASAPSAAIDDALTQGLKRTEECPRDGRPSGGVEVIVTFDPNGLVSSARVEGAEVNPDAKACILSHLRSLKIPAFQGEAVSVRRALP
jgi:hypothetical protein